MSGVKLEATIEKHILISGKSASLYRLNFLRVFWCIAFFVLKYGYVGFSFLNFKTFDFDLSIFLQIFKT
jgi:hypothetical protein